MVVARLYARERSGGAWRVYEARSHLSAAADGPPAPPHGEPRLRAAEHFSVAPAGLLPPPFRPASPRAGHARDRAGARVECQDRALPEAGGRGRGRVGVSCRTGAGDPWRGLWSRVRRLARG